MIYTKIEPIKNTRDEKFTNRLKHTPTIAAANIPGSISDMFFQKAKMFILHLL